LNSTNLPNGINSSAPFTIDVSCSDNVNNYQNQTYKVIVDDLVPILTVQETGARYGTCISGNWGLSVQSSDNHSNSVVEKWNGSVWVGVSGVIGVPSGFNGTITLVRLI
jgi:hypothetical protein